MDQAEEDGKRCRCRQKKKEEKLTIACNPRFSVKPEQIHESSEVNKWVNKYLGVGEWVLDQSVAFAGSSRFFERTR
jgi:hypothetical protein